MLQFYFTYLRHHLIVTQLTCASCVCLHVCVYVQARQNAVASLAASSSNAIDPEFLAALPPDIQADVIRQHQREEAASTAAQQATEVCVHVCMYMHMCHPSVCVQISFGDNACPDSGMPRPAVSLAVLSVRCARERQREFSAVAGGGGNNLRVWLNRRVHRQSTGRRRWTTPPSSLVWRRI